MIKYLGITIGPTIQTLMMARKPRELWSASYMLSLLAQRMIEHFNEKIKQCAGNKEEKAKLLSPFYDLEKVEPDNYGEDISDVDKMHSGERPELKNAIGKYPDRIFFRITADFEDEIGKVIDSTLVEFAKNYFSEDESDISFVKKYFRVSAVVTEAKDAQEAIHLLNMYLDGTELCNVPIEIEKKNPNPVLSLIQCKEKSTLFKEAFNDENFRVSTLAEIAAVQLSRETEKWEEALCMANEGQQVKEQWNKGIKKMQAYGYCFSHLVADDEDAFYRSLRCKFPEPQVESQSESEEILYLKPFHKYMCIVQADGDRMGDAVKSIKNEEDLYQFSEALMKYGKSACDKVKGFGGFPIYAGGDDLLFIAPVIGKDNTTILDLLKQIDQVFDEYLSINSEEKRVFKYNKDITVSMSYGVSVSYYKYPLYEAFEKGRHLLFDVAKNVQFNNGIGILEKNAIAWALQKNSGSTVEFAFSKWDKALADAISEVIQKTVNKANFITAVCHKIRSSDGLLSTFMGGNLDNRLAAFANKTLEYRSQTQKVQEYLDSIKELLKCLLERFDPKDEKYLSKLATTTKLFDTAPDLKDKEKLKKTIYAKHTTDFVYAVLRTAKFLKGLEEDHE